MLAWLNTREGLPFYVANYNYLQRFLVKKYFVGNNKLDGGCRTSGGKCEV